MTASGAATASGRPLERELFIDPQRCIGCRACVEACSECPSHGGTSMIHLDFLERATTVQSAPTVCMHCEEPACINVCPADAITKGPDGVVHTAMTERCIGCSNCVLACPFGVPKYESRRDLMMKCDLCYDRTAFGMKPMCATVCPSGALLYATRAEVEDSRQARPLNVFQFGDAVVRTKIHYMVPAHHDRIRVSPAGDAMRSVAEQCLEEAIV
jgi:Fe-S-cluster-containing dehydrogenase component